MKSYIMNDKGSILAFALVVATAISIIIISMTQTLQRSAHAETYLSHMNSVSLLAEVGMNEVIGRMQVDPNAYSNDPSSPDPGNGLYNGYVVDASTTGSFPMWYRNELIGQRDLPVAGNFYIQTTAWLEARGKTYKSVLHSYTSLSNAGDYFLAVRGNGWIGVTANPDPIDGKIVGGDLQFEVPTDGSTLQIKWAGFSNSVTPAIGSGDYDNLPDHINIQTGANSPEPENLSNPVILPDVNATMDAYYRQMAGIGSGSGHDYCLFQDHDGDGFVRTYPPGYEGGVVADDDYDDFYGTSRHTGDNNDKLYVCPTGDVEIEGEVHGEIFVYVSAGNIYIKDSLERRNSDWFLDSHPQQAGQNPSEAHQMTLITRNHIIIDNTFYDESTHNPATPQRQIIHAYLFAPNGLIYPEAYPDNYNGSGLNADDIHNNLQVEVIGAMLAKTLAGSHPLDPNQFGMVFLDERSYNYDQSYQDYPHDPRIIPKLGAIRALYEIPTDDSANIY